MTTSEPLPIWDRETFNRQLQTLGMSRYHHEHPFHRAMNEGRLSPEQLRGWVANRFHYQRHIPIKDAAILSNCPLREVRRLWIHRLTDHDGHSGDGGGLEAWLKLAEAAGLGRHETEDGRHVLPSVRFAVEAYVTFARMEPWQIAVASSLTELFAPDLMKERLAAFERYYPWIPAWGLDYFRRRVAQARNDSLEALEVSFRHCDTRELQERAIRALSFKCDLLWSMLDAITLQYGIGASPRTPASTRGPEGLRTATRSPEEEGFSPVEARPRLTAHVRMKMDPVTGKPALLYPEGVMLLNPTGEAIVRLCDGMRTVPDIVRTLADRYQVSPEVLGREVTEYLGRLQERRMLEVASSVATA